MTGIILVFIRQRHQSQREKMSGVYSAAIEHGWQIQPIDEPFDAERFRALKRLWSPIGCFIDDSALPVRLGRPQRIAKSAALGVPVVILGKDTTRKRQVFDCSVQNARAPALAAAQTLKGLGVEHFVYIGDPEHAVWSEERGRHFARAVRSWDFRKYDGRNPNTGKGKDSLADFLRAVPRPFGVLLAADHVAMTFYAALRQTELTVGTDLFIVGVDNDEMLCSSLSPTLSSVQLDFFRAGRNAVSLLDRRRRDGRLPPQYVMYGMIDVVNRASTTRHLTDRRLSEGLVFIAEHGTERITTEDVAHSMKCGRRLAEKLFRSHTRQSILSTIRQKRLEKAKALLANTLLPVDAIPPMCGYDSLPHFKTFFRQQTGMTMREWRRTALAKDPRP